MCFLSDCFLWSFFFFLTSNHNAYSWWTLIFLLNLSVVIFHAVTQTFWPLFLMIVWCYGLPWWLRPVKNLPAMQETRLHSLGQEDTLEKGMATHSRFLPGESHGQRSPVGCTLWSCKELDTTEQLKHTHNVTCTTWWLSGKESACQCRRQVQSLGQEDPLEKEMAIYSSILAGEILWTEELVGYSP